MAEENKFVEYPKWCHETKEGKVIRSQLVNNKEEENSFYGKKSPKLNLKGDKDENWKE